MSEDVERAGAKPPRPAPRSQFGAWLVMVGPEMRLIAVIVGGFLAIGFLMGFDLPGR